MFIVRLFKEGLPQWNFLLPDSVVLVIFIHILNKTFFPNLLNSEAGVHVPKRGNFKV